MKTQESPACDTVEALMVRHGIAFSYSDARLWCKAGSVRVNGEQADRAERILCVGDVVEVAGTCMTAGWLAPAVR